MTMRDPETVKTIELKSLSRANGSSCNDAVISHHDNPQIDNVA